MKLAGIKHIIFSALLLASFLLSLEAQTVSAQLTEEQLMKPSVFFLFHFENPNIENQTVNAKIHIDIDLVKNGNSSFYATISSGILTDGLLYGYNVYYGMPIEKSKYNSNSSINNVVYYNYESESEFVFHIFGNSEFYPFDRYYVNLTFNIPSNYELKMDTHIQSDELISYGQSGWKVYNYSSLKVAYNENIDMLSISQDFVFERLEWTTTPFITIIALGYLLLGTTLFIEPKELRVKSALFTSIFVFFGSFFFNFSISIPKQHGLSIGENMMLYLIIGAAIFLIFSVVQYVIFKEANSLHNRLPFFNHAIMLLPIGAVIFLSSSAINSIYSLTPFPFWIRFPNDLCSILTDGLLIFWIIALGLIYYRKRKQLNEVYDY